MDELIDLYKRFWQSVRAKLLAGGILMAIGLSGCGGAPVQVQVDDLPVVELSGWPGKSVGEALAEAGIPLGSDDFVSLPLDAPAEPGTAIQVRRARAVQIYSNGQFTSLATADDHPADWLADAKLSLAEGDRLAGSEGILDPQSESHGRAIRIEQSVKVTIEVDGKSQPLQTFAPTVGQAVWQAGIPLLMGDLITPDSRTALEEGMTIVIRKARPVTIVQASQTMTVLSAASRVGDVLAQAGLGLQGLDYSIPAEGEPVPGDGTIQIMRVHEEVQVAQSPLAFEVQYQPDPETVLDNQRVIQAGEYGVEAQRVRIRYENSVEVSRSVEEKWLMSAPQAQIVGYGTKIEVKTAVVDGVTLEYYRAVQMYATSYSPCRSGGTRCYPNTSSGKKVTKGVVAVLLRWYLVMQGQGVYIPGYGYATIEDVGGGIPGRHWIDLGYTDEDYVSWHQWLTVYFLTPVPPNVMAILP